MGVEISIGDIIPPVAILIIVTRLTLRLLFDLES